MSGKGEERGKKEGNERKGRTPECICIDVHVYRNSRHDQTKLSTRGHDQGHATPKFLNANYSKPVKAFVFLNFFSYY